LLRHMGCLLTRDVESRSKNGFLLQNAVATSQDKILWFDFKPYF
jgi:hypothetical protein